MLRKLLKNKFVVPIACLIGGMAIGAIFYPSKSITREETAKYERVIIRLAEEKRQIESESAEYRVETEKQSKEYKRETESKLSSLTTENRHLKQKTKESIVKIIKPDGTITEKTVRTSDTEIVSQIVTDIKQEFNEKVSSIENKWKTIHTKRVTEIKETYEKKLSEKEKVISSYSKKETIKVNERKFGLSLGYTADATYYSGLSYSVFGPFFLDFHVETDNTFKNNNVGAGIGVTF